MTAVNACAYASADCEVADGGTVVDPAVVRPLLRRRRDPLERLNPREREVLTKLDLPRADETHRRVLAVPACLRA